MCGCPVQRAALRTASPQGLRSYPQPAVVRPQQPPYGARQRRQRLIGITAGLRAVSGDASAAGQHAGIRGSCVCWCAGRGCAAALALADVASGPSGPPSPVLLWLVVQGPTAPRHPRHLLGKAAQPPPQLPSGRSAAQRPPQRGRGSAAGGAAGESRGAQSGGSRTQLRARSVKPLPSLTARPRGPARPLPGRPRTSHLVPRLRAPP